MAAPPLNPLVEKIRAKYPGAYDDMDDAALTKSVLAKYPGYADLAAPSPLSSVAKPNVQMQTSGLGQAAYGPPSGDDSLKAAGYPGPAPSQINPYTSSAAMALGPAAIAGRAGLGAARTVGPPIAKLAAKHPIISTMAISEARRIPYVGKYIPPYSELIPLFLGKGGKVAAEGEAAAGEATSQIPKPVEQPLEIKGTSTTAANPSGFPQPGPIPAQNVPYTPSGESAARHILGGFDNQTLMKIAKSRGVNISAERLLKPTVGNGKIIEKLIDDMKPEELQEIRDRWLESTRMGLPQGIGPEAYQTAAQQTYFPDLRVSKAKLGQMTKAMANRRP